MAINIVNLNGLIVLNKLGVDQALIEKIQLFPSIKVTLKNTTLAIQHAGATVWSMPTTTTDLLQLQKGQLPEAKKVAWLQVLTKALQDVISSLPAIDEPLDPPDWWPGTAAQGSLGPAASSAANPAIAPGPATASIEPGELPWAPVPDTAIASGSRVKLAKASRLYQPVFGTSQKSRYFVVAGSEKVKVAARYKDGTLSIRAEGPSAGALTEIGFKGADDGHFSVHFAISDTTLASKTLGAVLVASGVAFETQLPQLAKIAGKGA